MQMVKRSIIVFVITWIAIIVLMPKQELYYKLEEELAKHEIILNEEEIDEGLFSLKLKQVTVFFKGIDVATITDIFVTKGIGSGKWTPDFAILLAGPISHIICLMAKGYGIEYDLGVEDNRKPKTANFFKSLREVDKKKAKEVGEEVQEQMGEVRSQAAGFMAGTPKMEGGY